MPEKDYDKVIWGYWDKGESEAPYLVKKCFESWRLHNPTSEVIVLSDDTVWDYFDDSDLLMRFFRGLTGCPVSQTNWRADILRLALLRRYGGVWVDGTLLCFKPLASWLPPFLSSSGDDFWCFNESESPNNLSFIFTSFLAGCPSSVLLNAFYSSALISLSSVWDTDRSSHSQSNPRGASPPQAYIPTSEGWFLEKPLPYFWPVKAYSLALATQPHLQKIWRSKLPLNRFAQDGPLALTSNYREPLDSSTIDFFKNHSPPMLKLSYKGFCENRSKGSKGYYAIEKALK